MIALNKYALQDKKALFNSLKEMTICHFAVEAGYFIPIISLKY
jgi:hypothetical protein